MRIFLSQKNYLVGNIEKNYQLIKKDIDSISKNKPFVYITPELSLSGYPPEDLLFLSSFKKKTDQYLLKIVKDSINLPYGLICIGFPRFSDSKAYNSVAIINNGKIIEVYDKQQLINNDVFDEKRYFQKGENKVCIVNFLNTKLGFVICEDIWHKEPINTYLNKNIDFLIAINASPFHKNKHFDRINLCTNFLSNSNIIFIYLNLIGGQDNLIFDGGSFILNKNGVLYQLPFFEEQLGYYNSRENNISPLHNHFNQNLIYKNILNALVLGTRDYIHKNNFKSVVLGLSGGVDSALVCYIAVKAIGPGNVKTVMMPTKFTSKISLEDAQKLVINLNINQYEIINIDSLYEHNLKILKSIYNDINKITSQNIQSRIRSNILMSVSNNEEKLLLTTGNKSEYAVGYCTIYGDMSGAYAVIKDLLKTEVYDLCRYINVDNELIPNRIINRPPSAELDYNQVDYDSLPPYEILDTIIKEYLEKSKSIKQIQQEFNIDRKIIDNVFKLIKINEFKRNQSAIGPKISIRSFGKEWRMPITNGFNE